MLVVRSTTVMLALGHFGIHEMVGAEIDSPNVGD